MVGLVQDIGKRSEEGLMKIEYRVELEIPDKDINDTWKEIADGGDVLSGHIENLKLTGKVCIESMLCEMGRVKVEVVQ